MRRSIVRPHNQSVDVPGGVCLNASWGSEWLRTRLSGLTFPLCIMDPPYGGIVDEPWDKVEETLVHAPSDWKPWHRWEFTRTMLGWVRECIPFQRDGDALYFFGGTGKPKFRPFYEFAASVELETEYHLIDHVTWKKRRAYGQQRSYLYTREELLYLVKGSEKPTTFHIPLLPELRGYPGYNPAFPAKSDHLRRTNVWTDIPELLRGKVHPTQKPEALLEIPILAHTNVGDLVLDPFAGSGSTAKAARAHDRRFVVVERDPAIFATLVEVLK